MLQTTSLSQFNKEEQAIPFINELNLSATHSDKTRKDELQIIQGLIGMFAIITKQKKSLAFNGIELSHDTPINFAKKKF